MSLFLLNRDLVEAIDVSIDARGFGRLTIAEAHELHHADLQAINSKEEPTKVAPSRLEDVAVDGGKIRVALKPASWNVIRFEVDLTRPRTNEDPRRGGFKCQQGALYQRWSPLGGSNVSTLVKK